MAGVDPCGPGDRTRTLFPGPMLLRHRLLPCVWLGFLILPLVGTWGRRSTSPEHGAIVTAVTVVFALLFAYAATRHDVDSIRGSSRQDATIALGLLATTFFLCFYDNTVWAYIFVYALFPVMRLWPQGVPYRVVAGMAGTTGITAAVSGGSSSNVVAAMCVVLGSGASWLGFGRLLEANAMLARAQEDKAKAAVATERLRFARDLHDLLGHSLSVITLKSEVAGRLLAVDAERARAEVAEIEQVARQALKEVREAVGGYRQTTVPVELAAARTALAAAQVTWTEEVDAELELPAPVEAALAWTIREGVTNVLRHSQAATCALRVGADDVGVTVSIADDGVGGVAPAGNGLRGLGERIASVGGALEAGSGEGGVGYRLTASVPLGQTVPEVDARASSPASVAR